MHRLAIVPAACLLCVAFLWGCGSSKTVITESDPVPMDPVSPPLPGVDSLVIADVLNSFHSTFVHVLAETEAEDNFLEGRALFERIDSTLSQLNGDPPLASLDAPDDSTNTAPVDTTAFTEAHTQAQLALIEAGQAQAQQDSLRVRTLLAQSQGFFENALALNPRHEDARHQLAQVYSVRAQWLRQEEAWGEVLTLLRGLLALRADDHALWAEVAVVLETLNQFPASALTWLQATEVVLDDSRLAFVPDTERPPPDSLTLFTYYVRSYRAFVESRDGEGVRHALSLAQGYTTASEQEDYARNEMGWVLWDHHNFENRLVYDSLQTLFATDPSGAQQGLAWLIPRLTQTSARMEASYNHALLAWENNDQEGALDTLQALWNLVVDSSETKTAPYPEFVDDLRQTYATTLFERALEHRREGASAMAFTYLLQVTEVGSQYTGRAFVEALRLARYNPEQARLLEPRIEKVFDAMQWENQLAYLTLMGNLYRRIGDTEKVRGLLDRYRTLRATRSGQ